MENESFYHEIKNVLKNNYMQINLYKALLSLFKKIFEEEHTDQILKMTRITIVFEALYRFIRNDSPLKKELRKIRLKRWENHYGTPTVTFLLTYESEIEETSALFSSFLISETLPTNPWIMLNKKLSKDHENNIAVNEKSLMSIAMPLVEETKGTFLKTHNPEGGFTTIPCDPISETFLQYTSEIAKNNGAVLEIGAAFGAASLQALMLKANVFCNDIDPRNLAVVKNRYAKKTKLDGHSITGDEKNLILLPGSFHEELKLPKNFFDAILISRVLHFFSGDKIEKSLETLKQSLKPGGKLFIVCETPFLKNWKKFIPEYEKRLKEGDEWPGEITKPSDYESSGRINALPKFVHWLTKEPLERTLKKVKFDIELLTYINRKGQFPDDLLLDGRESIGAIVYKSF